MCVFVVEKRGGEGAENNLLAKLSAKLSNFNSTDETEDGFL